jgi:3-methyladenine DNA glycosylase AlkD
MSEKTIVDYLTEELRYNSKTDKYREFCCRALQICPGGYGEGDQLLGCPMPVIRKIAREHQAAITNGNIQQLLQSDWHEIRTLALVIMLLKFRRQKKLRADMTQMYLDNISHINNWDLVDISAPHLIGEYFTPTDAIFHQLSNSSNIWANRIAIIATHTFLRQDNFATTLELCQKFMQHPHHLIHKACGWMLREIGKRNLSTLINFLEKHQQHMPKIMLSYAREKLVHTPKTNSYA